MKHIIVGTGRWGGWLAKRMVDVKLNLVGIYARNPDKLTVLGLPAKLNIRDLASLEHDQLQDTCVWLCVSDQAIRDLSARFSTVLDSSCLLLHCSGAEPLLKLTIPTAVVWPIQSFSQDIEPDWRNIPSLIQGSTLAAASTAMIYATQLFGLSPKQVESDADRLRVHLAAVLIQNFGNLLWSYAGDVLTKVDANETAVNVTDLIPLAQGHLNALAKQSPDQLQTGPAVRKDTATMQRHLALLDKHSQLAELYKLLSAEIRVRAKSKNLKS